MLLPPLLPKKKKKKNIPHGQGNVRRTRVCDGVFLFPVLDIN